MLSNRLSLLVKAKGRTQKSIADKMGVSEQALSRYLHGKTAIGADSLEVLLSCLGINVEKLVDAEIAKAMKSQEKLSARKRNLLAELQEEQVSKVMTWYSKTNAAVATRK